jgi:hypothetical protein
MTAARIALLRVLIWALTVTFVGLMLFRLALAIFNRLTGPVEIPP